MMKRVRFPGALMVLLMLTLGIPGASQTKPRRNQIKRLIKKSDLVALAVAKAYYPIVDLKKYRREKEAARSLDPRRRSKYMYGTVYKLTVKEIVFQEPQKGTRRRVFFTDDAIMVYVKGTLAHTLVAGQPAFFPGTEYLVFLKHIKLDAGDFQRAVRQDVNAPMRRWVRFPSPEETYFKVLDDALAAKPMDDVWQRFADQTRRVAGEMAGPEGTP